MIRPYRFMPLVKKAYEVVPDAVALLAFEAAKQHFVVDLMRVLEVLPKQGPVVAPQMPKQISGYIAFRGRMVLAIAKTMLDDAGDIAHGIEHRPVPTRFVVLRALGRELAVPMDAVPEVIRVPRSALIPNASHVAGALSLGVCRWHNQSFVLLDVRPLAKLCETT